MVTVVVMLFLVATIAVLLAHDSAIGANTASSEIEAQRAEYVTQAGMQHALWRTANNACMGDISIPSTALGLDNYTATITGAAPATSYDLSVDQDAWIRSDDVTRVNGTTVDQHIRFETGSSEHTLTRFNLSSIPANARINTAIAWFYVTPTGPSGGAHPEGPITVHRVSADWTETDATWNSMNGEFEDSVLATISAQATDAVWVSFNLTAQVQAWANGQPNYGILMRSIAEGVHGKYSSREDGGNAPRLEVVVGSGPASPVSIQATGVLANGNTRVMQQPIALALQPSTTSSLQPDAAESSDAEIWAQSPNNNYGDANETWVSSLSNDTTRSLLRFNMEKIPIGARILQATLSLQRQSGSGADQPISAHRITSSWNEDAVTWNDRETGTNWGTAGGDFAPNSAVTIPVGPANQRYEWNITPLVQGWVDGSYSNYGVALVAAIDGIAGQRFYTSDQADPTRRPSLSITYACECGNACVSPQGTGNVLMPVSNVGNPTLGETQRIELLESWGYIVDTLNEQANQGAYDSGIAASDVVFVPSTADPADIGSKLANATIGVVSELGALNDELGIATGVASPVGSTIYVSDSSHYITQVFATGPLDIYTADMAGMAVAGTEAPGLQTLGDWSGAGGPVVLDTGAALGGGISGENAAGRRVLLPIGNSIDMSKLNNNGHLIIQRSLAWGMNTNAGASGNLLLVVSNPSNLTAQEDAKKSLIESWGYTVNLIDDSDSQTDLNAAAAANDVVYVSEDINHTQLTDKLRNSTTGVVNEEQYLFQAFGFSDARTQKPAAQIDIVDNSHYITSEFPTGLLTIYGSEQLSSMVINTAAGVETLGTLNTTGPNWDPGLVAIEAGAEMAGGGLAPARRVKLPFQTIVTLNANGQTIMRRAIEWGAGAGDDVLGPIAHWKMDDGTGTTAIDSIGGHDGALINGPAWTTGQISGALDFDGSNDYVTVPHVDTLSITEAMTFIAWVNASSYGASYQTIVAKDAGGAGSNYYFGTWQQDLEFGFWSGGLFREIYTSGLNLQAGTWYHLAASFDNPTGEVVLYVDGTQVMNGTLSFNPSTVPADLTIGRSPDGERWRGLLDDVRIYDRALSAAEILDLFTTAGGGGDGGGGACDGTFRDEFNQESYANNDGTLKWSTDWLEINEKDGWDNGDERVDDNDSDFHLQVRDNDGGGEGLQREADLSGSASAGLSYEYRRDGFDNNRDFVMVQVSADGGGSWVELERIIGPGTDSSYVSGKHDISDHIAPNTRIRFLTSSNLGSSDELYIDNIQIEISGCAD